MQPVVLDALPVFCRENMAERIVEIVHYHFGHARSARSKIHEHKFASRRTAGKFETFVGLPEFFGKIVELRPVYRKHAFKRLAIGKGKGDMFVNVLFVCGENQFYARLVTAVSNVFRRKHMGCGDKHDAEFAAGNRKHPVFPAAVEHAHNEIAAFHAVRRYHAAHFIG